MRSYTVVLSGCDDRTDFVMDLSAEEAALLEQVSAKSRAASDCGCMPVLFVYPTEEGEPNP